MSTVKFFESRGPELEAAHDECGGYVINYEQPETGRQGYLLLCSESAVAWGPRAIHGRAVERSRLRRREIDAK